MLQFLYLQAELLIIIMAKRVFCIGNGESRKGFDLEKLRPHGKIYGGMHYIESLCQIY